jgi:hypothetical protein
MTATEIAGAILWGGLAAAVFLRLLQRDMIRLVVHTSRGRFVRATLRVVSTAIALVLVGVINIELVPLSIVGFLVGRNALLWQIGGRRGH